MPTSKSKGREKCRSDGHCWQGQEDNLGGWISEVVNQWLPDDATVQVAVLLLEHFGERVLLELSFPSTGDRRVLPQPGADGRKKQRAGLWNFKGSMLELWGEMMEWISVRISNGGDEEVGSNPKNILRGCLFQLIQQFICWSEGSWLFVDVVLGSCSSHTL